MRVGADVATSFGLYLAGGWHGAKAVSSLGFDEGDPAANSCLHENSGASRRACLVAVWPTMWFGVEFQGQCPEPRAGLSLIEKLTPPLSDIPQLVIPAVHSHALQGVQTSGYQASVHQRKLVKVPNVNIVEPLYKLLPLRVHSGLSQLRKDGIVLRVARAGIVVQRPIVFPSLYMFTQRAGLVFLRVYARTRSVHLNVCEEPPAPHRSRITFPLSGRGLSPWTWLDEWA